MKGLDALIAIPKSGGSDLEDAAQDMLDAIKDRDAAALASAMRRAYECCADEGEDDSDDEE